MKKPTQEEVQKYFTFDLNVSPEEAEKFYNYYAMLDWKIKGKYAMKSWQHAARNWMLKAKDFNPTAFKQEYSYQDVVYINNDSRDKRTFAMFQRTPKGTWIER